MCTNGGQLVVDSNTKVQSCNCTKCFSGPTCETSKILLTFILFSKLISFELPTWLSRYLQLSECRLSKRWFIYHRFIWQDCLSMSSELFGLLLWNMYSVFDYNLVLFCLNLNLCVVLDVCPCQNGGSCQGTCGSSTVTCLCPNGFTGPYCELVISI